MKFKKILLGLSMVAMAASSQAGLTVFDNNLGGTPKGTSANAEIASSADTNNGEPFGDLHFNGNGAGFTVTAGRSVTTNLASGSFNISDIDLSLRAYQDLVPEHGGLGAVEADGFSGDNLSPNYEGSVTADEVLFFDFDALVSLTKVYFNGAHVENTAVEAGNRGATDYFNIFTSTDGVLYTSVFGGHQMPTAQEFLDTGITSQFSHYAIAATGWASSVGGYVEAIEIATVAQVSAPATMIIFGLGLVGVGAVARKRG